jgi:hypothetical protein
LVAGVIRGRSSSGTDRGKPVGNIYFSFVTATSIGFGDLLPLGPARVLAVVEGTAGLLLFGSVVTKLVSNRQKQAIEEIHLQTFESRRGRVQTNLHMVLSELQFVSTEFENHGMSQDRLLSRVESAAMVLTGEIKTIHDLLYCPQQIPEEAVFKTILANLVSCLSELKVLVDELQNEAGVSPMLNGVLSTIRSLSIEICSDCVPQEHAEELRLLMNRVQEQAKSL